MPTRSIHFRGGAALVLAMAMFTAACGGSDSQATEKPRAPATVHVALDRAITTLDPDRAIQPPELSMIGLVGGTLTSVGPDGKNVRLDLADHQEVSKDGLTWTFHLRSGTTFSDGSPLTARDVATSVERSMRDDANVHASFYAPIDSVTASGDRDVVFHLKSPYASLPTVITQPEFAVFPADKLTDPDFFKAPISSGPYTVSSYPDENRVELTRNPKYAGPRPGIAKLAFQYIQDPGTRLAELKSGQVQWAGSLPPELLKQLNGNLRSVVVSEFAGVYLYVNTRQGPLSDVRVRKAISLAIDRNQLNAIAYQGKASPLLGFLPATLDYRTDNLSGHDLAAAKQQLVGSACAGGCQLTIMVRNGLSNFLDVASAIQQQLKPLGIEIKLERTDPGIASKREASGGFQLEVNNLLSRANFPDGFLNLGLLSTGAVHALYSGYASPKMDAAIQDAIAGSGTARTQAMQQVNEIFAADLPYIPLLSQVSFAATSLPSGALTEGPNELYYVGSGG